MGGGAMPKNQSRSDFGAARGRQLYQLFLARRAGCNARWKVAAWPNLAECMYELGIFAVLYKIVESGSAKIVITVPQPNACMNWE
jgi:hypothetical protein